MEGKIFTYSHFNGRIGAMAKITTQTDFASRTNEFNDFGRNVVMQIASCDTVPTIDQLLKEPFIRDSSITLKTLLDALSDQLKEKVEIVEIHQMKL